MAAHTDTSTDAVPLLPQQQQQSTITTPCCCQQREQPHKERQTYDIIKQCRQCRRQIRSLDDEYGQDDDDNGDDVNVKYCECLLGAQSTDGEHEHVDDTDEYDDVANGSDPGRVECKPLQDEHRAERRRCHAKLGKPIRVSDTAAATAASPGTREAWLQNVAAHSVAAEPAVVTRCAKYIVGAVDSDDDGDDVVDDDMDDLHARLVNEKSDGRTTVMDNSGLPTYDAAAKLRPMCVRLN